MLRGCDTLKTKHYQLHKENMNTETLFGLALGPLYAAMAQVESTCGKYSPNVYQIDAHGGGNYIADVNRICERMCLQTGVTFRPFPTEAKFDRRASERMMAIYWQFWGMEYEKKTGERVTYEVLARIHNGGPLGWKKRETVRYWQRVRDALIEIEADEVAEWMKGGAK